MARRRRSQLNNPDNAGLGRKDRGSWQPQKLPRVQAWRFGAPFAATFRIAFTSGWCADYKTKPNQGIAQLRPDQGVMNIFYKSIINLYIIYIINYTSG
jgi:hypothetical protein